MAKTYSTLPLSTIDELSHLNGALSAFDELMAAWLSQTMSDGPCGDVGSFPAGVQFLLQPVIEGYRRIEEQAKSGPRVRDSDLPEDSSRA